MPAQPLVRDDAQRVDVGLRRGLFALRLLGGDVLRGADDHAILRDLLLVRGVGDAEIGDFHFAVVGDHDVRRLHIAVDHTMRVGDEQPAGGLDENRQQTNRVHGAIKLVVEVCQRLARHIFHDEEADAVVLVVFEQRGDVRVRQIGGIAGLRTQAAQFGLLVRRVFAQRLDGHGTTELNVVALPHLAHTALGQTRVETVPAMDELSFNQSHCWSASFIIAVIIGPAANEP